MKKAYRYHLDKTSRKFICPAPGCGKKRYNRYVDSFTNEYLPYQYGSCERIESCKYHLNPYTDGFAHQHNDSDGFDNLAPIPKSILEKTIQNGYEANTFIQNLLTRVPFPFDSDDIEKVISMYCLGTVSNGYRKGAVTMPFIDEGGSVRFIQVKNFDTENHTTGTDSLTSMMTRFYSKRKEGVPGWLQKYNLNELRVSCLFGAHLLPLFPNNRIALVEAPKTAIYGTLYFGLPKSPDDLLWLAVYNRGSLKVNRCRVLEGRTVILFPDLSADGSTYQKWREDAHKVSKQVKGVKFIVSDLLEEAATDEDRKKGLDLADYLINLDWRNFRNQVEAKPEPPPPPEPESPKQDEDRPKPPPLDDNNDPGDSDYDEPNSPRVVAGAWDFTLKELEDFFENAILPDRPFKLNAFTPVQDCRKFFDVNFQTAMANNGNPVFRPYLDRVIELRNYLGQVQG